MNKTDTSNALQTPGRANLAGGAEGPDRVAPGVVGHGKRCPLFAALAAGLLSACSGGGDGGGATSVPPPPVDSCSIAEQNQFVYDLMQDIYYWVDELPVIDPTTFDSPEDVLEALRFTDLDRYSFIQDAAEADAFFSASQFIGVGVGIGFDADDRLFIKEVFSDGPAAAAGLARGYEVLSINGQTVADIVANEISIGDAFGADEIGVNVDVTYLDSNGVQVSVSFAKALVTIETVSATEVIALPGRTVGYIGFRNFVEPSFDALEVAFAQIAAANVDDVVLDLRYNGGGLISVAEFLSGLLGGVNTAGEVFANRVHNAANVSRNVTTRFSDQTNALDLDRLVIITTGSTASASELVVNGLAPFVDVTLIGADTFGKPVGSYGFEFCTKVANPIAFTNTNAAGFNDYFDGFAVDCPAEDDLDFALGDPQEASLAEALVYLDTGGCSAAARVARSTGSTKASTVRRHEQALSPRRQLINAY